MDGGGLAPGRAADQREAGQRDDGVDARAAGAERVVEELLDRRREVEAAGKDGDDLGALALELGDNAVVVACGGSRRQLSEITDNLASRILEHQVYCLPASPVTRCERCMTSPMIGASFSNFMSLRVSYLRGEELKSQIRSSLTPKREMIGQILCC